MGNLIVYIYRSGTFKIINVNIISCQLKENLYDVELFRPIKCLKKNSITFYNFLIANIDKLTLCCNYQQNSCVNN